MALFSGTASAVFDHELVLLDQALFRQVVQSLETLLRQFYETDKHVRQQLVRVSKLAFYRWTGSWR
jgi:hypothetical protein